MPKTIEGIKRKIKEIFDHWEIEMPCGWQADLKRKQAKIPVRNIVNAKGSQICR